MSKKKVLRFVIFVLIVIWMIIVFNFSNQNGEKSSSISREIAVKVAPKESSEEKVNHIEQYIRKIAHLSEYTCGGILFLALFLTYKLSDVKRMTYSLLIGIEYAIIDEIHQLFIDGRTGQIVDVLIDTIGISIGICILMLMYKIFEKRKEALKDKQKKT